MLTQEECAMLRDVANSARGVDKAAMIVLVDCVGDVRMMVAGGEEGVREMKRWVQGALDKVEKRVVERGGVGR